MSLPALSPIEPWSDVDEAELVRLFKAWCVPPPDFASLEQRARDAGLEQTFEQDSMLAGGGFAQTRAWEAKTARGLFSLIASGGGRTGLLAGSYIVGTEGGDFDRALQAMRADPDFGDPAGLGQDGARRAAVWMVGDATVSLVERIEANGAAGVEMHIDFQRGAD